MVSPTRTANGTPRTDRTAAPAKRSAALIAVLGALSAVAPLATDMYVPGFPAMGAALHAGSSAIQLTMTTFLAGLVAGQLVIGPLSDTLGRRGLLIGGTAAFAALSLACALAPNVQTLLILRLLQGVAAATGMVLARAVLTDRFEGPEVPRYFALLAQVLGIAPVAAPVLGGAILGVTAWRGIFVALALAGALLTVAVLAKVPETLPPQNRQSQGPANTFRAMGRMCRQRTFMGYVLVLGLTSAALFAYISGSSFVFEHLHGVSPTAYSLIFATNAVGMLIAGFAFSRLSRKISLNTMLTTGIAICGLGVTGQLAVLGTAGETLAGTWAGLFVTLLGVGLIFPAATTLGQALGRTAPGAASALLGGLQFLFGALASPLVGLFGETSSTPMALIMLIAVALAALALITLARPWLRHGETLTDD
ncbi:Bcr/CflA family drug resistance efflux transporter [Streptomyces griseocarneus]|nr:Bcr/CflA family drug resistance efflux transporter [Streptomyces griseocarneus]